MGMRVQHNDRQPGQLCGDFPDVTHTHAGIEEHGLLVADDQVADGFFGLMRFVNGENGVHDFVDFEPRVANRHALEAFVFRPWKGTAPLGDFRLRRQSWC